MSDLFDDLRRLLALHAQYPRWQRMDRVDQARDLRATAFTYIAGYAQAGRDADVAALLRSAAAEIEKRTGGDPR